MNFWLILHQCVSDCNIISVLFRIESGVYKADTVSVCVGGGGGAFSSHRGNFSSLIPGAVIRYEICVNIF